MDFAFSAEQRELGAVVRAFHPAHLYLRRAKSGEALLGSPARHRAELATLVGI